MIRIRIPVTRLASIRASLGVLVVGFMVCGALPVAAYFVSDGTFLDSDWTMVKLVDTTPSAGAMATNSQALAGGNPSAYRQTTHVWSTVPAGVSIIFAHVYGLGSYDTSVSGPINGLAYQFDASVSYANYVGAVAFQILVVQGGQYFAGPYQTVLAGSGWQPLSGVSLVASDFTEVGGSANPDFSATGGPVQFGYLALNGGSGGYYSLGASFGVDNWQVSIDATVATEPTSFSGVKGLFR